jgi:hypothetical protein
MYCTISMIDGFPECADHNTLPEAEAFATDVAREGASCRVVAVIREYPTDGELAQAMSALYKTAPNMHKEAYGW